MQSPYQYLARRKYPGRGIMVGTSPDGKTGVVAYFIMGRSVNSRNRVFVPTADGIRTQAWDESKLTDPSLIIYAPMRTLGAYTIVTNGDQTDSIYDCIEGGGMPIAALRTRSYEPDAPNYTPRISCIIRVAAGAMSYKLSILKSDEGREACLRYFFEYDTPLPGEARIIHTYANDYDGDPLPSFAGEPAPLTLKETGEELAGKLWKALDADNKVALVVRDIDIATGRHTDCIINKNGDVK